MKQFPKFTKQDLLIMVTIQPILVLFVNFMLFGLQYFFSARTFLLSGLLVFIGYLIGWFTCTWIAVTVRNKFPNNKEIAKRIFITVFFIVLTNMILNTIIFLGYDYFNLFGYELNHSRLIILLCIFIFINISITLLHEGFETFEKWKSTFNEADKLKTAYAKSQLLSLKSQVNPHFLFNSLNSLSSLINEDEVAAEKFLIELTRVYRYFLRDKEDQLVTLKEELQFIRSFFYLLKVRYGSGIELSINTTQKDEEKFLPPLTLQVIFEEIFTQNRIQRDTPLRISITSLGEDWIQVENNVQKKIMTLTSKSAGLVNLGDKFKLLTQKEIIIDEDLQHCIFQLPLINNLKTLNV